MYQSQHVLLGRLLLWAAVWWQVSWGWQVLSCLMHVTASKHVEGYATLWFTA